MTYQSKKDQILNSPPVSYALKDAIKAFDKRDAVDALHDALALVELLKLRVSN